MKLIIAGSRDITSYELAKDYILKGLKELGFVPGDVTIVVSGKARGMDTHGETWAAENKKPVEGKAADWVRYKRAAGPIRNEEMAKFVAGDGACIIVRKDGSKVARTCRKCARSITSPVLCLTSESPSGIIYKSGLTAPASKFRSRKQQP